MRVYQKIVLGQVTEYTDSLSVGIPIFFIHGNSAGKEVFFPMIQEKLGAKYRCIAFDLLGCGVFSREITKKEELSFHLILEHIKLFITSFKFEKYFIVGHSLGGHLYLECANQLSNTNGAFLVSVSPLGNSHIDLSPFQDNPVFPFLFTAEISEEQKAELIANLINDNNAGKELLLNLFSNSNPFFRTALADALSNNHILDEVAAVFESKCPISLVNGVNDRIVNSLYLEQFSKTIWKNQTILIESAGHYPQLENPGKMAGLIDEFVLENL